MRLRGAADDHHAGDGSRADLALELFGACFTGGGTRVELHVCAGTFPRGIESVG